jgi:hypothetical protein
MKVNLYAVEKSILFEKVSASPSNCAYATGKEIMVIRKTRMNTFNNFFMIQPLLPNI